MIEPSWVCLDCADARGAEWPDGHVATFHVGICGICNGKKAVTEPRDFGKDRNKLKIQLTKD